MSPGVDVSMISTLTQWPGAVIGRGAIAFGFDLVLHGRRAGLPNMQLVHVGILQVNSLVGSVPFFAIC